MAGRASRAHDRVTADNEDVKCDLHNVKQS